MSSTLFLATNNSGKINEFRKLFQKVALPIEVHAASELGVMPIVEETEDTFEGNARLKAQALWKTLKNYFDSNPSEEPKLWWILADDSGLCVDALQGKPGVYSARYAGIDASAVNNNQKLLNDMRDITTIQERSAYFVCSLVLLDKLGKEKAFEGRCYGHITTEAKGEYGFGYDPLFMPKDYNKSMAQLGNEVKNNISHRAHALKDLLQWLQGVSGLLQ